jgi:tetratricopeptide (TPR) repeat protein
MQLRYLNKYLAVLTLAMFLAACHSMGVGSPEQDREETSRAPAYYNFATSQLMLKQGDLNEAIWMLENAITADPGSDYLKLELVNLLVIKKETDKALGIIETVLSRQPDNVRALTMAGRIYQQQGNQKAARKAFEKVLAADGSDANIYIFLGRMYWDENDMRNADRVFSKMVARFPDSYVAHYFYGKVQAAIGEDERAEAAFLKSLALEPSLEEPRFDLIKIFSRQNKRTKVIQTYQEILELNPDNLEAAFGLAGYYHDDGNDTDARKLLEDVGRRARTDDSVIKFIFNRYLEPKEYDTALWVLTGMLAGDETNSDLHYLAGVACDGLEKKEQALSHLTAVDPQSRFYPNAVIQRAWLLHDGGRIDRAIGVIEAALSHDPVNVDYFLYLGSFYEELERYSDALDALKRGLAIDDKNSKLHFRMGVVYDKMGQKEASITAMKTVVRLKPDNAEALNYLGYTYADMGINLDEAEALIQSALQIKPDDGYITDSLGWVYFKRGQYQDALKLLNKAVQLVPEDPVILEHLGDVYLKMNQTDTAIDYYQRSMKKKHKNKEALEDKIRRLGIESPSE